MSLDAFRMVVRGGAVTGLAGAVFLVLTTDPDRATAIIVGGFFLSFFLALWGMSAGILLALFRRSQGDAGARTNIPTIVRFSALLSGLVSLLALLRFFGWLTWWAAALLIAITLLIELTLRRVIR